MGYGRLPLFPPMGGGNDECVRVPLFQRDPCRCRMDPCGCKTVRMENPCCPGDGADVMLSVDECGNLMVCVRRDPPCRCGPNRPRRC